MTNFIRDLMRATTDRRMIPAIFLILITSGCSSSDSEQPTPEQPISDDPVENTLMSLGVPTDTAGPAVDGDRNELPASYEPLGAIFEVSKPIELLFSGGSLQGVQEQGAFLERVLDPNEDPDDGINVTSLLHVPEIRDWTTPGYSEPYDIVAGDIDGDGLEETVIAYVDVNGLVVIYSIDDSENNYSASNDFISPLSGAAIIHSIDVEVGDFDQDGISEIAVAIGMEEGTGNIFFLESDVNGLSINSNLTRTYQAPGVFPLGISLSFGNADYDNGSELAITVNVKDIDLSSGRRGSGIVSVEVLDFSGDSWTELFAIDDVQIEVDLTNDGTLEAISAIFAKALLVDIDADVLAELIIVGLNTFRPDNTLPNSDPQQKQYYMLIAHEDAEREFLPLEQSRREFSFKDSLETDREVRYVHVNPVDIDGDQRVELQVNNIVFDNFSETEGKWEVHCTIGTGNFLSDQFNYPLAQNNSASAVGDINADGKENIAYLAPNEVETENSTNEIKIFGDRCQEVDAIPVVGLNTFDQNADKGSSNYLNLNLTPVNLDDDGIILQSVPGQHFVTYTEPLILAALAAPPCAFDIGQNIDDCSTSYGSTSTIDLEASASVTVSGSLIFGAKVQSGIFNTELEVETTVSGFISNSTSLGISRSESVVFNAGPMEDTVLFSTVPYDVFEYAYLRYKGRSDLVGSVTRLLLPRPPLTLMVEKEFYNGAVSEQDRIGDEVFQHTVGELDSYPTLADRDRIMFENLFVLDITQGLIPWVPPARTEGAVHVGEGGGSVELGLAIGQETSQAASAGLSVEVQVKGVAVGALAGFSVGVAAEVGFSKSYGEEMSYTGTVGSLDAEHFADHGYSFGLFTYHTQKSNGDVFEVINYWIEPD